MFRAVAERLRSVCCDAVFGKLELESQDLSSFEVRISRLGLFWMPLETSSVG